MATHNSLANVGTSSGLLIIPNRTRALCRDANLVVVNVIKGEICKRGKRTVLQALTAACTYDVSFEEATPPSQPRHSYLVLCSSSF